MKFTRRASLALALGGIWTASAKAAREPDWSDIDMAARKLIEDRAAPGMFISVSRRGRFIYSKGFGFANLETQTPASSKSICKIGSVTKQFTAAGLLALAEDGKLSIDDPLARYFPDFPRAGEITLRQMMSHTSGLGNYTETDTFRQDALREYDAAALYQLMLGPKTLYVREPGTAWVYSNTAYILLGLIVEKVAGQSYGAYLKRRLFDRAGLSDTMVDAAAEVVARRASGYSPSADATGFRNAPFISMTVPGGAGSLRSTTEDLCRWHDALFGGKVLAPDSLTQMTTPQRLKDGSLPVPEPGYGDYTPVGYGLGLEVSTHDGRQAFGHRGFIYGFSSSLQSFPAAGVSIALNVNCFGGPKVAPATKALRVAVTKDVLARP